ncbi:hypothetical protein [Luteolibacter sp. AS25]|uniref:hypothetical protein n=1 Tax=Luteolibacter sp. AS25 TaxID=3135776 RepID=UPI00398B5892
MKTYTAIVLLLLSVVIGVAQQEPKKMATLDQPRYKENPIYLFFESYIQDVIGYLPEEKSDGIQELNLDKVFDTKAKDWRGSIRETLHLSETIDIAILDLWYRNREHFKDDAGKPDPVWFSEIFTDKYIEDDSKVDVWGEGALEAAKARILEAKKIEEQNKAEMATPRKPSD